MKTEHFDEVVKNVRARLEHMLLRESCIGTASRNLGTARLKQDELHGRLERLRDDISTVYEKSLGTARSAPSVFDLKKLRKLLKPSSTALDRKRFKGMHARTLLGSLILLEESFEAACSIFEQGSVALGDAITPDGCLHLLTEQEVYELFEDNPTAHALAACLGAYTEMRNCLHEVRSILDGYFGWQPGRDGPYEKRRGALIAAQLIGVGVGLGLRPTRGQGSREGRENTSHSACDAVVIACEAVDPEKRRVEKFTHPVAKTIFGQMPEGYKGMEHIWSNARTDQVMASYYETGLTLGSRMTKKAPKLAS